MLRFVELTTENKDFNVTIYNETIGENETFVEVKPILVPSELRQDPTYSLYYILVANSLALAFIPMLMLIFFNSCIFYTIAQVIHTISLLVRTCGKTCIILGNTEA